MGIRAHGVCGYINNCSYENMLIRGPEYFMDDHEEESNRILTCSDL